MDEKVKIALDGLCNAIVEPGVNPQYHAAQIARLRKEWPTLYQALINLISAYKPVDLKRK